jgi:hypothetical protein
VGTFHCAHDEAQWRVGQSRAYYSMNMVNQFVPQVPGTVPLRDPTQAEAEATTQGQLVQLERTRAPRGHCQPLRIHPGYTDAGEGREMIVEVKFISQCSSRYGRVVATSLRATGSVNLIEYA